MARAEGQRSRLPFEMITIFAVPKPFVGHIGLIQTNALRSWLAFGCEVILFGDEPSVEDAARVHGARHVNGVQSNEFGTPLLNDVFEKARETSTTPVLCYVNADILLLSDFLPAVERVRASKPRFLMVGRRWNIDLAVPIDFSSPAWERRIRTLVTETGQATSPEWIDYFVFNRDLFDTLRPFALGRAAFDNWLLWLATQRGAALVDATKQVMVVHQNHDYSHHPEGKQGVWDGVEAQRNRKLMETWDHCFFITDATHRLSARGVHANLGAARLQRLWSRRRPRLSVRQARFNVLGWTSPARKQLGLTRSAFSALRKRLDRGT